MYRESMITITIAILGSILLMTTTVTQVEARNITAFVHFNGEVLNQDTHLDDAWYTVDGKNYSGWYYDMSDAIYGDSSEPNTDGQLVKELVVADNASKICFQDTGSYKSCGLIDENATEIHFSYPASAGI